VSFVKVIKGESNMKKIGIFIVILVMVFAFTIPAAAGGHVGGSGNVSSSSGTGMGQGLPGGRGTFVMVGTITALGTNSVTIDVVRGNKLVQPIIATQMTITVTPQTLIQYRDATSITMISFADLQVGQQASISGIALNSVWMVYRITIGAVLSCLQ
jgi:hypothetical protein